MKHIFRFYLRCVSGLRVGWDNLIPSVSWDAILLKNVPWDGMEREILKIIPSYERKIFRSIPSHSMEQISFVRIPFFLLRKIDGRNVGVNHLFFHIQGNPKVTLSRNN